MRKGHVLSIFAARLAVFGVLFALLATAFAAAGGAATTVDTRSVLVGAAVKSAACPFAEQCVARVTERPRSGVKSARGALRAPRSAASTFVDLGSNATMGNVIAVNALGDVLTQNGFWRAGVFTTPPAVTGGNGATMSMTDMGPNGIVVGYAEFDYPGTDNPEGTHMVEWDPTAGTAPAFVPPFPGVPSPGTCGYGDTANAVSSSDQVGGALYLPATGCQEGTVEAFTANTDGSSFAQVPALPAQVVALSDGWAVDFNTLDGFQLFDRASGAVTDLGVEPAATASAEDYGAANSVSRDGVVVGEVDSANPDQPVVAGYQTPGGSATQLLDTSSSSVQTEALAINDSDQIVGVDSDDIGALWESPTSEPTALSTVVPTGWTVVEADAIDDSGDIAGEAYGSSNDLQDVMFTVTPRNDLSATVTLAGPNGTPFTGGASAAGSTLVATVTLTASASASAPITGIVASPPLTVTPSVDLMPVSGPAPAPPSGGYTLQPGASTTYTETYAVASTGTATLALVASGVEDGATEMASAQTIAHLGQSLKVTVAWLQNGQPIALSQPNGQPPLADTIRLADNDSGEVPQDVTAQVTVRNTGAVEQDDVSFNGIPAVSYHNPADAAQALPIAVTAGPGVGPPSPATLPNLTPGQSTVASYTVQVSNNGTFDFSPQVLSSDAGGTGTNVSQGVGTISALPTAYLYFQIAPGSVPTSPVMSGSTVSLYGSVTNRSLTQSIDVPVIEPDVVGNGDPGIPTDDAATPRPDGYIPPVAGIIKPGATEFFHAAVNTAIDGGTRATLTYAPTGYLINPDQTETQLTGAQVRIGAGSGTVQFAIDDSAPVVDPNATGFAGGFTAAFAKNAASWLLGGFNGAKQLITNFPAIAGHAVVATGQTYASTVRFLGGIEFNLAFWASMSDAQHRAFEQQVADDIAPAITGVQNLPGKVADAISAWYSKLTAAAAAGDWQTLGQICGSITFEGGSQVASALLTDGVFQAVGGLGAKAAEGTISLAESLREAEIVKTGVKTLAGLRAGDNLLARGAEALENVYGIGKREIAELQYWAKERGLLISVRSRNPESLHWIEKFKAVVKPEILKIKNVDAIDTSFLGYLPDDLGSVVFAKPLAFSEVERRIKTVTAGLDATDAAAIDKAVTERFATRNKEWFKYKTTYEDYSKAGRVNIGFDAQAQGIIGPNQSKLRRFKLEPVKSSQLYGHRPVGDSDYFRVLLGDNTGGLGALRRVTGDIDVVAILKANGEILPAAERAALYVDLENGIGMQHGETLSWLLNGDFVFDTKLGLLADHLPTNELLAVFGPDGSVRAASINPGLTIFNKTTQTVKVALTGAYTTIQPAYAGYAAVALGQIGAGLNSVNPITPGN